jgi:divalent metal cation (Fe/Co/Zn/Cd) transporter
MGISIAVDVSRSRMLYAAARKHKSQALEADALHFSTDIWSSSVVIVGLGLVWISARLGTGWAWLAQADAVAALVVACIVIYVSLQLGRRAVAVLLDAAPPGLIEKITSAAATVDGVQSVGPVRVRQAGASTFADLTVAIDRSVSLEEAHQVASEVEAQIGVLLHRGDVVVHVDPIRHREETLPQTVSAIAARLGLRAHNIHAHDIRGRYFVDLHAEVPPELTLAQAHEQVSRLEMAIRHELAHVSEVNTHVEPRVVPLAVAESEVDGGARLRQEIVGIVESVAGLGGCHEVQIRPNSAPYPELDAPGYDVVIHCLADPELSIVEAHRLAELAEKEIRATIAGVGQVLIHVEPEGEA